MQKGVGMSRKREVLTSNSQDCEINGQINSEKGQTRQDGAKMGTRRLKGTENGQNRPE